MRPVLVSFLALSLVVMAAPAVEAQQAVATEQAAQVLPTEQPAPHLAPKSMPVTQVDTDVATVASSSVPAESSTVAVRETSARNILAIIGGVVVVVALIAFLR